MSIIARDVHVKIAEKTIIKGVSIEARQGELLVIVGANGAGKSTLIKTLSGDLTPSQGQVSMGDHALKKWKLRDRAKVRAVLPQNASLTFPFTVLEVVLIGRTPHLQGVERPIDFDIARQALAMTGMLGHEQQVYTTLSGGERQRVQLARVLAQIWENGARRYLLVDEPTNNLDLAFQHRALQIAREFANNDTAVIAVLHDLNLAAQYADRIVVLKEGVCIANGTPKDVLTPAIIHEAFAIRVMVQAHPVIDCPLVIALP